jgi:hypothetical protein
MSCNDVTFSTALVYGTLLLFFSILYFLGVEKVLFGLE